MNPGKFDLSSHYHIGGALPGLMPDAPVHRPAYDRAAGPCKMPVVVIADISFINKLDI